MDDIRKLIVVITLFLLAGCTGLQQSMSLFSSPEKDGKVSHGMTPSSTGPSPEWYAEYYNPARGVGEALSRSHQAMWDNDARGYTYYIGGEIFARYHPWQHGLIIRTDNENGRNLLCRWSGEGKLKMNGPRLEGLNFKEACTQLLNTLQSHLT